MMMSYDTYGCLILLRFGFWYQYCKVMAPTVGRRAQSLILCLNGQSAPAG